MLVWEENHARGLSEEDMRNPNFERQCEDCIREMIGAHYNHPSIYIWGILNECASHTQYGRECYRKQLELIRSLDQTRPRSFASCQFKTDICFDLVDVVSYNIYPLWYHDTPADVYLKDLYDWVQKETGGSGKPFLITEVGAGGHLRLPDAGKGEMVRGISGRGTGKAAFRHPFPGGLQRRLHLAVLRLPGMRQLVFHQAQDHEQQGHRDEYRRPKLAYATVKKVFSGAGKEE